MMDRLKAWRLRAREERGAADPILVVAGIAVSVILLIGGTFAIGGFIRYSADQSAQGDLDRLSQAQSSFYAENERFGSFAMGPSVKTTNTELADAAQSYMSSENVSIKVRASRSGWVAVASSKSSPGVYIRTSEAQKNILLPTSVTSPKYGTAVESDRNYFRNSGAKNTTDLQAATVSGAAVTGTSIGAAKWSPSGSSFRTTLSTVGSTPSRQVALQARFYESFEAANKTLTGQTVTMTAQLRSSQDFALYSVVPVSSAGSTRNPIASSMPRTVPANTTITAYVTFNVPTTDYGTASRINFFVGNLDKGQTIEMSAIDLYPGAYDSSRSWFNGSMGDDGAQTHKWAGTAELSSSIRSTRPVLTTQPSGISWPSGITWADVAGDVALVAK